MKKSIVIIYLILLLSVFEACQSQLAKKNLDPESSQFIFIAKYIITAKEYKEFLNLPDSQRAKFIKEFWKRRDPEPDTEENEFKQAYMTRMDEAKQIFGRAAGRDLTDRGEVYVLFGPPDDVYISTRDKRRTNKVLETWYYAHLMNMHSNVEILFIDRNNPGNMGSKFRTGSFSPGSYTLQRHANVISLMEEAKASFMVKDKIDKQLKLGVRIRKLNQTEKGFDLIIRIDIPYQNIWFSKGKEKMEAVFSLKAEVFTRETKKRVWNYEQDHTFSVQEEKVEELMKVKKKHIVKIPSTLSKGKYWLYLTIKDKKGDRETQKKVAFKV